MANVSPTEGCLVNFLDLVGRAEAERGGIADVELQNVRAGLLHAVRLVDDGSAHVVEHVVELGGLPEETPRAFGFGGRRGSGFRIGG